MNRLTAPLIVLGIALVGVAFWLYSEARDDYKVTKRICGFAGECSASMSWTSTLIVGLMAVGAFVAASVVAKRTE